LVAPCARSTRVTARANRRSMGRGNDSAGHPGRWSPPDSMQRRPSNPPAAHASVVVVDEDVMTIELDVVGTTLVLVVDEVLVEGTVDEEVLLEVDELVLDDVLELDDVLVLVVCEVDVDELVDVDVVVGGGAASARRFCAWIVPRPVTMSYPAVAV